MLYASPPRCFCFFSFICLQLPKSFFLPISPFCTHPCCTAAKDTTKPFDSVGHSEGAKKHLWKYPIGVLRKEDAEALAKDLGKESDGPPIAAILVGILLLGLLYYYFMVKGD